jgi:hypothetical protein
LFQFRKGILFPQFRIRGKSLTAFIKEDHENPPPRDSAKILADCFGEG